MPTKTRRPGRPRRATPTRFLLRILDWDADYTFGKMPQSGKLAALFDPVDDFRHIRLKAEILSPNKLAGQVVDVTLIPTERQIISKEAVGDISQGRNEFRALMVIPQDVEGRLLTGFGAGAYRFLTIEGPNWFRRRMDVEQFSLSRYEYRDVFPDVVGDYEGLRETYEP